MDDSDTGFLCPECGSTKKGNETFVSCEPTPSDPWTSVLQTVDCPSCGFVIPAHLAQRWDSISPDDARKQWRQTYRSGAQRRRTRRRTHQRRTPGSPPTA